MLALGLALVVLLTLVALSLAGMKANQKSSDLLLTQARAHQVMEQEIYQAQSNSSDPLWVANSWTTPVKSRVESSGSQEVTYALYAQPLSHAATNGLMECKVRASWWSGRPDRPGYGQLFTEVVRIVSRP